MGFYQRTNVSGYSQTKTWRRDSLCKVTFPLDILGRGRGQNCGSGMTDDWSHCDDEVVAGVRLGWPSLLIARRVMSVTFPATSKLKTYQCRSLLASCAEPEYSSDQRRFPVY